ncbi:hypothetical protein [Pandoraea bronchicola]|uniref:Secreted protein n=1 Tax=Pandoraea bronchicola TaxID=2508287 RepID=A0A5E5BYJ6_9BURK|nr:hypothetical protein [Pandoraea bronchicola]VVE89410.1 hypothetical protein PBR20603_03379 [Pandoraea bronchicola]
MKIAPKTFVRYALAVLLVGAASRSFSQSCDCTEIVGSCQGAVSLTPTGSQKGLYGADLAISANAAQCARVEYFVDNTPAFTILVNGRSGSDRVMGTSEQPLTASRVAYQGCRICKAASDQRKDTARNGDSEAENLFAAALANDTFNPNSKEEGFQRLAGASGGNDATISAMMSVMQGMQQLQAAGGGARAAAVQAPVGAAQKAMPATCTSAGFRTCDFGSPNPGPR